MDKAQLKNLYITRRMSQRDIAEKLDCSEGKVRYFLKKYGITKKEDNIVLDSSPKVCPQCNLEKPKTEFYMKSLRGKKRPGSWCKSCMNNKVITRQRGYKNTYVQMKGGCCQACGFDKYDGAMEFHHVDPASKEETIARMARSPSSPEIIAELAKCVLVCSNCHKMIHAGVIECPPLSQNRDL